MIVHDLFVRDKVGIVIPKLREESAWVLLQSHQKGNVIATIKVDGISVKVTRTPRNEILLWRRHTSNGVPINVLCDRTRMEDKPLWEAYENNLSTPSPGYYIVYGPQINGNPQGAKDHMMLKVSPIDGKLVLYGHSLKVDRSSEEKLYHTLRDELSQSTVEGIVYHLEEPSMTPIAYAKVTRADFGMQWPIVPTEVPGV